MSEFWKKGGLGALQSVPCVLNWAFYRTLVFDDIRQKSSNSFLMTVFNTVAKSFLRYLFSAVRSYQTTTDYHKCEILTFIWFFNSFCDQDVTLLELWFRFSGKSCIVWPFWTQDKMLSKVYYSLMNSADFLREELSGKTRAKCSTWRKWVFKCEKKGGATEAPLSSVM